MSPVSQSLTGLPREVGESGEGERAYHRVPTALIKCIARAVSKTVRPGDLLEACKHAEMLYPWQESRV
jgi:hypothetical protein